jgi:hypothetical protein
LRSRLAAILRARARDGSRQLTDPKIQDAELRFDQCRIVVVHHRLPVNCIQIRDGCIVPSLPVAKCRDAEADEVRLPQ